MKIKITADSTCDLSPALIAKYGITIVPLYIIKEGKAYRDGVNIFPADIFRHVDQGGLCTTAAPNVADYGRCFARYAPRYDAVFHINIGSGFSGSYHNACLAAQAYDNVYVIDSQNLSSGQGHLVIEAGRLAEKGAEAEDIRRALAALIPKVETSFLIDRLDYLYKGGRCSLISALGANILHVKPCIEVINGQMQVTKKYRGSFERCVGAYVKERLQDRADISYARLFVTHPAASSKAVAAARQAVADQARFEQVVETRAGCTISCHCGPSTLGVLFVRV